MTKEEYAKTLEKYVAEKVGLAKHGVYYPAYVDGLKKAIDLAEKLDEPKKVAIPQFVADWIEKYDKCLIEYPAFIVHYVVEDCGLSAQDDWLDSRDNQKLLLNAIANGYEVEKEKKYRVKIKGIGLEEEEWLNCKVVGDIRYFELNSSTENEVYKTNFTKQWLKDHWSEFNTYNNAGLLEFEEVEDD